MSLQTSLNRSGNPFMSGVLGKNYGAVQQRATFNGILNKVGLSLVGILVLAICVFDYMPSQYMGMTTLAASISIIVFSVVISRAHVSAVHMAVLTVLEGFFLGSVSRWYSDTYGNNIVAIAVAATAIVAIVTYAAFRFFNIRATQRFKSVVAMATFSLFILYVGNFVLSLFHVHTGLVNSGPHAGLLSIAISVIAIVVATLNLVVDYDNIRMTVENGLPESEEWPAAFALVATLVWLYVEILRVLSTILGNNRN